MIKSIECKIKTLHIYEYSIPFKTPLRVGNKTIENRTGLVVALEDEQGLKGYGEIAPLEGASKETLAEAKTQVFPLAEKLSGMELLKDIMLPATDFKQILPGITLHPSVAFGVETSAVNLLQYRLKRVVPVPPTASIKMDIPINGLLYNPGPEQTMAEVVRDLVEQGFRVIKIKVGREDLETDIQRILQVADLLPSGVTLRLDANQLWDFKTAVAFGEALNNRLSDCPGLIQYIEEPFACKHNLRTKKLRDFYSKTGIPTALDQSLQTMEPEQLVSSPGLGLVAVVLKPTLLGGFRRINGFIDTAKEQNLEPVVSSCFEAGPGFAELLKIVATFNGESPVAGLDTLKYLAEDLFSKPLIFRNGGIFFEWQGSSVDYNTELLKKLTAPS